MQQSQGQSPSYHTNTNSCFFSSRDCAAKPRAVTLIPHKYKQTVQQSQGQSPSYHTNTNRLCNKAKGIHPHTTQIQTTVSFLLQTMQQSQEQSPSYHTNTNSCFFSSTDYAAKPRAVTLIPHKYKQLFLFFYRLCSKAKGSHPHTTQIYPYNLSESLYLLSSHVYRCVCNVASQLLVMSKWI